MFAEPVEDGVGRRRACVIPQADKLPKAFAREMLIFISDEIAPTDAKLLNRNNYRTCLPNMAGLYAGRREASSGVSTDGACAAGGSRPRANDTTTDGGACLTTCGSIDSYSINLSGSNPRSS